MLKMSNRALLANRRFNKRFVASETYAASCCRFIGAVAEGPVWLGQHCQRLALQPWQRQPQRKSRDD